LSEATVVARRGLLLVLSSPSGAGKTTLSRRLLAVEPALSLSVSATTRAQGAGEVDGTDYHFLSIPEFERRRDAGEFLEWAEVFANFYGTPRAPVEAALREGRDVLFDVDWQGAKELSRQLAGDVVRVFILPPSAAVLSRRLTERARDAPAVVGARMAGAAAEISHWREYDYIVVNDDLEASLAQLRAILAAERLKRERQTGLDPFVTHLLGGLATG
jgi:guanylate kinase